MADFEPISKFTPFSEPLPSREFGDEASFTQRGNAFVNEASNTVKQLNDDFIPKVNTAVGLINDNLDAIHAAPGAAQVAADAAQAAAVSETNAAQSESNAAVSAADAQAAADRAEAVTGATYEAEPSTVVARNAAGRTQVEAPVDPLDAANKGYVDGAIATLEKTSEAIPGTIMSRNDDGRSQTANPVEAQDVATKVYVDGLVVPRASQSQVNAGTNVAAYVSPDRLAAWGTTATGFGFGRLKAWALVNVTGGGATASLTGSRNVTSVSIINNSRLTLTIPSGVFTNANTMFPVFVYAVGYSAIVSAVMTLTTTSLVFLFTDSGANIITPSGVSRVMIFEGV